MTPYKLSPEAKQDLDSIWESIASGSVRAANRFVERVDAALLRLVRLPYLGPVHPFIPDPNLRVWPIYSYLIVYLPDTKPLEVVRIVSGHRDLGVVFGSGS